MKNYFYSKECYFLNYQYLKKNVYILRKMKKQLFPFIFLILVNQLILINYFGIIGDISAKFEIDYDLYIQIDSLQFNATNAYNYIISQLNFGYRVPGYPAHEDCANWIRSQLQDKVDLIIAHNFTIQKNGQPAYNCQNILGKVNINKTDIVIIGAHWDSRAVAEKDSINKSSPIPGANDGASGVAVLIELAQVLNQIKTILNAQIWFLFLDAEDQGSSAGLYGLQSWKWCEGSIAFNNEIETFYDPNNESLECFILLDMVGGTNLRFIDESYSTNLLLNALFEEGQNLGYIEQFPTNPKSLQIVDDHIFFLQNGIPSADLIIDFINGQWTHHHKHSDNITNIDSNSLNITGRTVESFIKNYYIGLDTENPDWGPASYIPVSSILLWVILIFGGTLLVVFIWDWFNKKNRD
ncbi:MAG: M28 family peptidase [Promethearchaeota archaeon]